MLLCEPFTARPPKERSPMNKLVHSLGLMVALAATSLLAGCELYFGSHDDNRRRAPGTTVGPMATTSATATAAAG